MSSEILLVVYNGVVVTDGNDAGTLQELCRDENQTESQVQDV